MPGSTLLKSSSILDGRVRPEPSDKRAARGMISQLIDASLMLQEDWDGLEPAQRTILEQCTDADSLLELLADEQLLTEYQVDRIRAGTTAGLVLGNYRILERLGAGGMGVVFKAEHLLLRQIVAVKVLPQSPDQDPQILHRFVAEMRAVAQLRHPNIVGAIDAGVVPAKDCATAPVRYFVMEYIAGEDLEAYVKRHGPMPFAKACGLAHQLASALEEAQRFNLVHRDIKPSNVLLTTDEQPKLLDFGLARHDSTRLTSPGVVLGSIEFMAPEQARDASAVDVRADIYGIGAVLYWCLTGKPPFEMHGNLAQDLAARLTTSPPRPRTVRNDLPADLDVVVMCMLALRPDDRYPTPDAVMRALLPFIKPPSVDSTPRPLDEAVAACRRLSSSISAGPKVHRLLLVDDEESIRTYCRCALQSEGLYCEEAVTGSQAVEKVITGNFDLVLMDVQMPEMTGTDACKQLRKHYSPNLKIIMCSGKSSSDEMTQLLLAGADDCLTKPFSAVQLRARVKAALRMKDAQDRSDLLNRQLLQLNAELERNLTARDSDLIEARNALVLALATLVGNRDAETGGHLRRMQRYCRCLAEEAAKTPQFSSQIDRPFIDMLDCCAPLHDIGKVALPDHILLKPGKLTPDERVLMQAHTVVGADILNRVAEQHGFAAAFLQTAIDITRHHHERFDGAGYPDRLAGTAIPLSARIVSIGDVYDALRSRRVYKPALSHAASMQLMVDSNGQFDPGLTEVFQRCAQKFEKIYREMVD
jgi:response regulator RpfG family c-di-GMP phosphodiesterase/serine/threonine protein kinase